MRVRLLLILTVTLIAWTGTARAQQSLPMADLPRPAAGESVTDAAFGARVTRLTDARAAGRAGITPQYSRRQAWNADESSLLLRAGDGIALLYDGSGAPFLRELPGMEGDDLFWHPLDPAIVLYNPGNGLLAHNAHSGEDRLLAAFPGYTFADTRGEGDVSHGGRTYAYAGWLYDGDTGTGEVTYRDIVVHDLAENQVVVSPALPALDGFDWVSISPCGGYVVVDYADLVNGRFHGVEVCRHDLTFLRQ